MIDLAIYSHSDARGTYVVETNRGDHMACPLWPQDSDFGLVCFRPGAKKCDVRWAEGLAKDIALAVQVLEKVPEIARAKPDWYRRLRKCAEGASAS